MLEEKILLVSVAEEPPSLLLASVGVTLNVIPLTLECVDNLALDVSHDLCNRGGSALEDLRVA